MHEHTSGKQGNKSGNREIVPASGASRERQAKQPVERFHEPRAEHFQRVMLLITAKDVVTRLPQDKFRTTLTQLMTQVGYSTEEAMDRVTSLIGDANFNVEPQPMTVEEFIQLDPQEQKIIKEYLLGDNPAIVLPHSVSAKGETKKGIVNSHFTREEGNFDRVVALVNHGPRNELISLVEGRIPSVGTFGIATEGTDRTPANTILTFNIEEETVWRTTRELAQEVAAGCASYYEKVRELNQQDAKRNQPLITVQAEDIEAGLDALLAVPIHKRKTPTLETMDARENLVQVVNESSETHPITSIAYYGTVGTPHEINPNEFFEVDVHPDVLQARQEALMTWATLLGCLPQEVQLLVYRNVVEVANTYLPVVEDRDRSVQFKRRAAAALERKRIRMDHNTAMKALKADFRVTENQAQLAAQNIEFNKEAAMAEDRTDAMAEELAARSRTLNAEAEQLALQAGWEYAQQQAEQFRTDYVAFLQAGVDTLLQLRGHQLADGLRQKLEQAQLLLSNNQVVESYGYLETGLTEEELGGIGELIDNGHLPQPPLLPSNIEDNTIFLK